MSETFDESRLMQRVTGVDLTNPLPTMTSLETIKTINQFMVAKDIDPLLQPIVNTELMYIRGSALLMQTPEIAAVMPQDTDTLLKLTTLVRNNAARMKWDDVIEKAGVKKILGGVGPLSAAKPTTTTT